MHNCDIAGRLHDASLEQLKVLLVHTNRVSGTVPGALFSARNTSLATLDLSLNPRISGVLPEQFSLSTALTDVLLNGKTQTARCGLLLTCLLSRIAVEWDSPRRLR